MELQKIKDQATQFRMVEAYVKSGKSQKEFSQEHKISYHALKRWVSNYRKHKQIPTVGFVPIQIKDLPAKNLPEEISSTRIEIHYPNGVKLFLAANTDIRLLQELTIHIN